MIELVRLLRQFNRTICIVAFMALCGYALHTLAQPNSTLTVTNVLSILMVAASLLQTYIGIKGKGTDPELTKLLSE